MALCRRALAFVVVAGAMALWPSGCATTQAIDRLGGKTLYVAPFVDETPEGLLGLPLTSMVREELWSRAPQSYTGMFDESSLALDGTVLTLEDRGDRVLVTAHATVVRPGGALVVDLGTIVADARYEAARPGTRQRAITRALAVVARTLLDRLDTARLAS